MNDRVEFDTRSLAIFTLPLDRVHSIARARGGKVNDVVLAVIDAALHDYLAARGEDTREPLVALCAKSVRDKHDDRATTQATALNISLGAPDADIGDRLQQVIESSAATKKETGDMSREALMDLVMVIVGVLELADRSGVANLISPSSNVLVSNVAGPTQGALYLRGSRLLSTFPIATFLPGVNLNITLLSHGNQIDFGMIADKQALPDLELISQGMQKRFAELDKAVLGKKRKTRKQRAN